MTAAHPKDYHVDLTEDRLNVIAKTMLQMVNLTYDTNSTEYDDRWVLGTAIFARVKNALEKMARSKDHPWLTLAKSGMAITPNIGRVPFRFASDDPSSPKKLHILQQNNEEMQQHEMAFPDASAVNSGENIKWRWYIEKGYSELDTPRVSFVGLDCSSDEIICTWVYKGEVPNIYSVDSMRPQTVIQSEPAVQLPAAGIKIKKLSGAE